MQDCKLHLLRWKFLPKLAALLHSLANIVGASEYQDGYVREMGPEIKESGISVPKGMNHSCCSVITA